MRSFPLLKSALLSAAVLALALPASPVLAREAQAPATASAAQVKETGMVAAAHPLAVEAGVAIVPISIRGTARLMPPGREFALLCDTGPEGGPDRSVRLQVHPPVPPVSPSGAVRSAEEMRALVRQAIDSVDYS